MRLLKKEEHDLEYVASGGRFRLKVTTLGALMKTRRRLTC